MADKSLTLADQVLVNAMAYLCTQYSEVLRMEGIIDVLREVLPQVNTDHSSVGPLAQCAEGMLLCTSASGKSFDQRRLQFRHNRDQALKHLADIFALRAFEGHARLPVKGAA